MPSRRPIPEIIQDLRKLASDMKPEPGHRYDHRDDVFSQRLTDGLDELEGISRKDKPTPEELLVDLRTRKAFPCEVCGGSNKFDCSCGFAIRRQLTLEQR